MKTDIIKTQHFTNHYEQIFGNLTQYIPKDAILIEPFVGNGELLKLFPDHVWEKYDIDPKIECIQQDTLNIIPEYKNKWIITNPPYLAKNKARDKQLFIKYDLDDLYKIALSTMLEAEGGLIVIPFNFFTDKNSGKIRTQFLNHFKILEINVFTTPIFDTTTYSVCAFAFIKKDIGDNETIQTINFNIFPDNISTTLEINKQYDYRLGGEILNIDTKINIFNRLVQNKDIGTNTITHIYLAGLDTRTERFNLSFKEEPYYGKSTDRVYATLISSVPLTIEQEKKLIQQFNNIVNDARDKYCNLIFTNYRDYNRKRVEFNFVYSLLTKIYNDFYREE